MPEIDINVFPASIVAVVSRKLKGVPSIEDVFKRPLRPTDPNYSLGVYAFDWIPSPGSYQIGQPDPAHSIYHIRIQCMVKHTQEEEGLREHSALSKYLRAMLYRDVALRAELSALEETTFGVIERVLHFNVQSQRFMTNEVQGTYIYLSSMDVNFNAEHTKL